MSCTPCPICGRRDFLIRCPDCGKCYCEAHYGNHGECGLQQPCAGRKRAEDVGFIQWFFENVFGCESPIFVSRRR